MPPTKKKPRNGHKPSTNGASLPPNLHGAPQRLLDMWYVYNTDSSDRETPGQKRMRRFMDESLGKFMAAHETLEAKWEQRRSEKRERKRVDVGTEKALRIIEDLLAGAKEAVDAVPRDDADRES